MGAATSFVDVAPQRQATSWSQIRWISSTFPVCPNDPNPLGDATSQGLECRDDSSPAARFTPRAPDCPRRVRE